MRPSRLLFALSIVLLGSAVASLFIPALVPLWWIPAPIGGGIALIDALLVRVQHRPRMRRSMAVLMKAGVPARVDLIFPAPLRGVRRIDIFDGIPHRFESGDLPLRTRLGSAERRRGFSVSYEVISHHRGRFEFESAWVEVPSLLGCWVRRFRLGDNDEVRVYPDLRRVVPSALHVGGDAGPSVAGHNLRRRGLGLEFHQLREYRQGDMMRTVDQKASSRFHKLIVREMREEEDQTVLFLLDTGYRMTATEDARSHFEYAFEAMLSLALVALRNGDRVGVQTWGPDARWIAPRRSVSSFPFLVNRLYDIEARPEASSPAIALSELLPRLSRRTFIVLLTNFREEDSEEIAHLVPLLRSRHLFCTVWIREAVVDDLVARVPKTHDEALETAMAAFYRVERERCRRTWESQGLLTIDTTAKALGARLVQRYWDIKSRGLL